MFKTQANKRGWMVLVVIAALAAWVIMVSAALAQEGTESSSTAGGEAYTVEIGDTLDTIAQRYNVSIISLFEVNGFDYGTVLFPGDSVIIPNDGTPYGYFPALSLGNRSATAIYIIQPLDVLDLVAAFFNVDLQCLAEFNGLELMDTNRIYPGTAIGIPTDCPEYRGMSSTPLLPLRGAALTGASVRLVEDSTMEAATPTPTPTAAQNVVVPTATVAVVIPPTATTDASGVIVQTPVQSGGIIRGATVTPTPQG